MNHNYSTWWTKVVNYDYNYFWKKSTKLQYSCNYSWDEDDSLYWYLSVWWIYLLTWRIYININITIHLVSCQIHADRLTEPVIRKVFVKQAMHFPNTIYSNSNHYSHHVAARVINSRQSRWWLHLTMKLSCVLTMMTRQMSKAALTDKDTANTCVFPASWATVANPSGRPTLILTWTGGSVTAVRFADKHSIWNAQLRSNT